MNASIKAFFKKWYLYGLLGISFLIGSGIILFTTAIAPWAFSDSAVYIWSAQNLASGIGLVVQNTVGGYEPMTWFPPLFPVMISIPVFLGADAVQAARWINAVSFGLFLSLTGAATWRAVKSLMLSFCTVFLLIIQPGMIKLFSGAISEPLFLVFTLAAMFAVYLAVLSPGKNGLWLLGGTLAGFSFLTRYTGIAVIGAVIILAMLTEGVIKDRLKHFALTLIPSILAVAGWFLITGNLGGRHILQTQSISIDTASYMRAFWEVIIQWIPYITRGNQIISPAGKLVVIIMLVLGSYMYSIWSNRKDGYSKEERKINIWVNIWVLFSILYFFIHLVSYIFLIEKPDVDMRLLSPIYLSWVMILVTILSMLQTIRMGKPAGIYTPLLLMLGFLLYFGKGTMDYSRQLHNEGWGYTSKTWQTSRLMVEAGKIDHSNPVYSNDPALILFYYGFLPSYLDVPVLVSSNETGKNQAVYVMFYPQAYGIYGEKVEEWFEELDKGLQVIYKDKNGGIYFNRD